MIITISGANFSGSGISSDSYMVRYNGNVTGNVTSIKKNGNVAASNLVATITMKSGYTYSSLSVTVGGATITGYTATDNGNGTVSLTVPANLITGTVVVSVVTTGSIVNPPSGGNGSGSGSGSGTPETPSDTILLNVNNKTLAKYSRLNVNAYVANMKQIMPKNTIISHIDIALADNTSTDNANAVTSTASLKELSVYVFNADTNLMIETIIDSEPVTSFYSEEFGKHAVRATINKKYDVPIYFGYDNVQDTSTNSIGCAYYSEAGNYLSGTAFDPNTPLSSTSSSVAVLCAIYGEPASTDNSGYTKIASYALDAASTAAANCWIAATKQTIPANTNIGKVAVLAKGNITGFNMAVVNAETNTLVEYLVTEQSQTSIYSADAAANVIEFEIDKTYDYPTYLIFNAERPNQANGIQMKSGGATPSGSGILYVDDAEGTVGSPEVGYVFTPSSSYAIGHIIYSKNN